MLLKKIELFGFKSFADKTVIELDEGVTGIVGPNGCGKSNITDAIRWALGEQSAKELRGAKMEDVIFNGTGKRQALGFSEVNICFDNSKRTLPLDFTEVVITRRLFRTGESEYCINKVPCRLKDIIEMIMDTGLGVDSYSVMSQGNIDFLVNAKPEERRLLFEEASGITKYKHKKIEALRKLEKVNENLNRLNDIILELEKQIKKLDSQVKKVQAVKKIQEELKAIDVHHILETLATLETERKDSTTTLDTQREAIRGMDADIATADASHTSLNATIAEKEQELASQHEVLYRIDSDIALAEEKIRTARERINDYKQGIQNRTELLTQLEKELNDIVRKQEGMSSHLETSAALVAEREAALNEIETAYKNAAQLYEDSKRVLDESKDALLKTIAARAEVQNKFVLSNADVQSMHAREQALDTSLSEMSTRKEQCAQSLDELTQKCATLTTSLDEKRQQRDTASQQEKEFEEQLEQLETQHNEYQNAWNIRHSMHETLKHLKDDFEGYEEGTREILKAGIVGIHGTIADCIDVDPTQRALVENVFSFYLNCVIVETEQDALNAITYLEQNKKGRCTFLVLSRTASDTTSNIPSWITVKDSRYVPLVSSLFGRYAAVKENKIFSDISISGGSSSHEKSAEQLVLGRERRMQTLHEEMATLEIQITETQNAMDTCNASLTTTLNTIEQLDTAVNELNLALALASKEKDDVTLQLATVTAQHERTTHEKQELVKIREEKLSYRSALEREIYEHEMRERAVRVAIDEQNAQYETANSTLENTREKYNQERLEFSELKNQEQMKRLEYERWTEQAQALSTRIQGTTQELHDFNEKISQSDAARHTNEQMIKDLYDKKTGVDSVYRVMVDAKNELVTQAKTVEHAIREKRTQCEALRTTEHDIEMRRVHQENEYANFTDKLSVQYKVSLDEARVLYPEPHPEYDADKAATCAKKIEAFGELNLAAPIEYQQIEERYTFLDKQRQDLVAARADLNKLIQKINQITRERFQETYDQVRNHFRTIFTSLFEGGSADLILTSTEDLLESGIEIMVQPPGKKLQSISLLSGGEKALVGIAILFSFYMIKPSPFCILDEIDAPLDDVNLQRFTRMLREFAKKSQFLIVTHNKKTMEMSDALYGVTMEEFGVSKLISVKFHKEQVAQTAHTS